MMHLSTHTWMRVEPLRQSLERAARYGYESVELTGEPEAQPVQETAKLLADSGLRCWGAGSVMRGERNLAAADPAQRARTVDYLRRVAGMVAELGGQVVTVVPTTVGQVVPEAAADREWAWVVEGLQAVERETASLGLGLAIEPLNRFETYLINRAEQALALADDVGGSCGVCLDTFHLFLEESDPLGAVRAVGDRLLDVHVADNNLLAPGMGTVDWPAFVRTLGEVGYEGALAAEFLPPVDRTPCAARSGQGEDRSQDPGADEEDFIRRHGSGLVSERYYSSLSRRTAQTLLPLLAPGTD
jgi:sugar phosphate isomerase/epimerase